MMKWVFGADTQPFNKGLDSMRGQTKQFAGSVKGMIAGAFSMGLVVAGFKKALAAASSLQEMISKSDAVFGKYSKGVEQWAAGLADSFGQAQSQAMDSATTFGAVFQALGVGQDEAVGMSKRLVELASDMASFNDTSVEEALTAIGAGLRGESEPLKRFAVILNDATLRAKAMAMGIYDGSGVLTTQQKLLASYNVILEQTGVQQGNFAATSDGVANSQRILAAQAENAAASIGTKLLPAYQSLLEKVKTGDFDPAIEGIGTFLASTVKAIMTVGSFLSNFVVTLMTDIITASTLAIEGVSTLGDILKKTLSGDFSGAGEAISKWQTSMKSAFAEVRLNHKMSVDKMKKDYEGIWADPKSNRVEGKDNTIKSEDLIGAQKAEEERKKLAEEIAEMQQEARMRDMTLAEQILAVEQRRADLIAEMNANGNETEKLEAQKEILKVEKELDALNEKRKKAMQDAAGEELERIAEANERIKDAEQKDAESQRNRAFEQADPAGKIKMLKDEQAQLLKDAQEAQGAGDTATAIEKRTAAREKGFQMEDIVKEGTQDVSPTISTSSLASIGAGGSANLLSNSTIEQRKVSLLEIIAANTARSDTGTTNIPEPV